ncbi:hypothetical protein ACLI4Z_10210 [Natrialbaceae archaeon A-arb3/5]
MNGDAEHSLHRRALLAATATPALAGCIVHFNSCTTGSSPFDTDAVDTFIVSTTSGAAAETGPCDDDTERCLHVHLEVDPDVIALIEVETPDGEVVRTKEVTDREITDFELSAGDSTDSQERTIILRDENGAVVDTGGAHSECRW